MNNKQTFMIQKPFMIILIVLGFITTCGQTFLTGRISMGGGNLLTLDSGYIPTSRVPTISCTERPKQKDHL